MPPLSIAEGGGIPSSELGVGTVDSIGRMRSFTLDGKTYEYLMQDPDHPPETVWSWTYGEYPKVLASVPLAGGDTVEVYAVAKRWDPSHILVSWDDDDMRPHWAWVPAGKVTTATVIRRAKRKGVPQERNEKLYAMIKALSILAESIPAP